MPTTGLRGFTVAVAADRRREEQAALLERSGVQVRMFPLLATHTEATGALRGLTERLISSPPDHLVANTGYGVRTWFALAAEWDIKDELVAALKGRTSIAARGAKALGELRKAGLDASYKAPGETLAEVVDHLVSEGIGGKSLVLQLHGEPSEGAVARLREAGAEVTCVPIYRMGAGGETIAQALAREVVEGSVDAVTFTAAPQVEAIARSAQANGLAGRLLNAINYEGVTAACIGEVCAGAARSFGVEAPLVPEHARLGSLATSVASHFERRKLLLSGESGPVRVSGALVEVGKGERWLEPPGQRALRVIAAGHGARGAMVDNGSTGATLQELRHLSRTLDGALEITGDRCRLLLLPPA